MLEINATLTDAQRFVDAITKAGGRVPEVLANILDSEALLKATARLRTRQRPSWMRPAPVNSPPTSATPWSTRPRRHRCAADDGCRCGCGG
jgi:hypothetical protein